MTDDEGDRMVHHTRDGRRFEIRPCAATGELDLCVAFQQRVWGYPDAEVVPRNMYVLAQALGGHVIAAWSAEGELAGFAMAVAAHEPVAGAASHWMRPVDAPHEAPPLPAGTGGAKPPVAYLHSHMLAVEPRFQNGGLGFALKQAQRADALARGITVMRWTFDPRMRKNAFFNLRRLGATARVYVPNFYGRLGSALQGGLPTDRLVAEWQLTAERKSSEWDGEVEAVQLPAELANWKGPDGRERAEQWQAELREKLQAGFARGLVLIDFVPAAEGGGEYRLVRRDWVL